MKNRSPQICILACGLQRGNLSQEPRTNSNSKLPLVYNQKLILFCCTKLSKKVGILNTNFFWQFVAAKYIISVSYHWSKFYIVLIECLLNLKFKYVMNSSIHIYCSFSFPALITNFMPNNFTLFCHCNFFCIFEKNYKWWSDFPLIWLVFVL